MFYQTLMGRLVAFVQAFLVWFSEFPWKPSMLIQRVWKVHTRLPMLGGLGPGEVLGFIFHDISRFDYLQEARTYVLIAFALMEEDSHFPHIERLQFL